MTTVSIAKSVDHSVNQTATVSIGYGKNMTVPLAKITTWFDEYLQLYKWYFVRQIETYEMVLQEALFIMLISAF